MELGLYKACTLDCGLYYGLMIIQSNSASVVLIAIMLSAIHVSASGVERVHGFTQTGEDEDYSNTTINSNLVIHLASV